MPRRIVQISDEHAEHDEFEQEFHRPPKRKSMIIVPIFVTLLVSAGATAIAWYSYNTGVREGSEGAAPLLKPGGPAKVTPESPGGLAIPNQDKTVYQAMEGTPTDTRIERLLPPPEMPAPLPTELAKPAQPESSKVRHAERLETPAGDATAERGPTRLAPESGQGAAPTVGSGQSSAPPPAPAASADAPATIVMPAPVKTVPPPKPYAAAPKAAPAAKSVNVARTTPPDAPRHAPQSGYGVQIASLSSAAKARSVWNANQAKHKDLLGDLSLVVQTAKVKGKTYHRVQGGSFPSRKAASDRCAALKKRGVGCVVVQFRK